MNRVSRRGLLLVAVESACIVASVILAAYVRFGVYITEVMRQEHGVAKALLIALICQICLYYSDLYDLRRVADRRELIVRIIQALAAASFILAAVYFWFPATMIGRGIFLIAAGFICAFIVGWRLAFEWLLHRVGPRQRLLLVGAGDAAVKLARELLDRHQELGVEVVGFVVDDPVEAKRALPHNLKVIGGIDSIPTIVKECFVDRVVVSLADARGKLPMDKLLEMKLKGVTFDHLASVYEEYTGKIAVENLRPSWLIFSSGFQDTRARRGTKRVIDVLCAAVGLVIAAPLMLIVGALVRLTSPGPALFRQTRVGQHGRLFTLYKFRSMRADAEATTGAVWSTPNDSRVTWFGRFIRMTRLDEMPQLWNVLRGDMSLVGPRPERPEFVSDLSRDIPFYGQRHVVRPGVTGWAQVRYKYGASKEDALEKLQYELFYIKNMSMALDLVIMFHTIKTIISGAEHGKAPIKTPLTPAARVIR